MTCPVSFLHPKSLPFLSASLQDHPTLLLIFKTIFVIILIGVILALVEAHKLFYDEEAEQQQNIDTVQETERKRFMDHLSGPPEGGNA